MKGSQVVKRCLHRMGWELQRYPSYLDPGLRRQVVLQANGVDLVIDVGANVGQYAIAIRGHGYTGQIISLEPLAGAFARIHAIASTDDYWTTLRTAVGAEKREVHINVAANSEGSSVLPMLDRLTKATGAYVGIETVPMNRLDDIVGDEIAKHKAPFLKVDAQGFERAILAGATTALRRIVGIEMELSFVPLYEGQTLWLDDIAYLEAAGFRLAGLTAGYWDSATGEVLQGDGLFVRA